MPRKSRSGQISSVEFVSHPPSGRKTRPPPPITCFSEVTVRVYPIWTFVDSEGLEELIRYPNDDQVRSSDDSLNAIPGLVGTHKVIKGVA